MLLSLLSVLAPLLQTLQPYLFIVFPQFIVVTVGYNWIWYEFQRYDNVHKNMNIQTTFCHIHVKHSHFKLLETLAENIYKY